MTDLRQASAVIGGRSRTLRQHSATVTPLLPICPKRGGGGGEPHAGPVVPEECLLWALSPLSWCRRGFVGRVSAASLEHRSSDLGKDVVASEDEGLPCHCRGHRLPSADSLTGAPGAVFGPATSSDSPEFQGPHQPAPRRRQSQAEAEWVRVERSRIRRTPKAPLTHGVEAGD